MDSNEDSDSLVSRAPQEDRSDGESGRFQDGSSREWLIGGGDEMGDLIRILNWSKTPIGPVETWSPALRMVLNLMLVNRFPSACVR